MHLFTNIEPFPFPGDFNEYEKKKKKKTKATLIQQGLKGHTHTELILWAGQYVFMGFKTEQWLDIACVSHMFGGSFFYV